MKQKHLLLFISFLLQITLLGKVKNAVVFGEHAQKIETFAQRNYRIFMDMNGDFYPENVISNAELIGAGQAQLAVWAKKYPLHFQKVAKSYHLSNTLYSKTNYALLQDSIRQSIIRKVNKEGKVKQTWIVHGFRKKIAHENIDNFTSVYENKICRNRINRYLAKDTQHLSVEVYWDGKYLLSGGVKEVIQLGYLFKNHAVPNAQNCGYGLRRIFSGIQCQQINLISHSAGVHVLTSLLYDVKRKYELPTPSQKDIRIAITAGAASGKKHFKRYYKRSSSVNFRSKDNYSLINLINENDFVLLKKFGRIHFTKRLGNTSLGCNYKGESNQLKTYFKEQFTHSTFAEAYVKNSRSHWFKSYVESAGFDVVLAFLFRI